MGETETPDPAAGADRDGLVRALGFVVGVNVLGAAPALLVGPDTEWFQGLTLPSLYPPGWAFGVVWTLLFTLLGIAAFLVWRRGTDDRAVRVALGLFAVQMAFNVAWTPAFFGLQAPLVSLAIIAALAVLVVATILAFDRVDRRAALLLVPYLAWVLFATYLNYEIWRLNA
jgi:benzodiazapine receptor